MIQTVLKGWSVSRTCKKFKRSRQSYYKACMRKEKQGVDHMKLLNLVMPVRRLMPRLGGRKLHFLLQDELDDHALKIGRDRFLSGSGPMIY